MRVAGRRGCWQWRRQALQPGDRTQLHTLAFGLAASRFLLRLLEPLRNPALAGRAEPAEGDGARLSVRGTALVGGWGSSAVRLRQRNSLQPRRASVPAAAAGRLPGEREGDRTSISSLGVMDGDVCRRVVLFVVIFFPRHLEAPSLTITLFEGAWLGRQALLLWGPKPQGPEAIFSGTTLFPWTAKLVLATSGRGGVLVSMELP